MRACDWCARERGQEGSWPIAFSKEGSCGRPIRGDTRVPENSAQELSADTVLPLCPQTGVPGHRIRIHSVNGLIRSTSAAGRAHTLIAVLAPVTEARPAPYRYQCAHAHRCRTETPVDLDTSVGMKSSFMSTDVSRSTGVSALGVLRKGYRETRRVLGICLTITLRRHL